MTNANGTKRRMTKAELDNRANQLNPNEYVDKSFHVF